MVSPWMRTSPTLMFKVFPDKISRCAPVPCMVSEVEIDSALDSVIVSAVLSVKFTVPPEPLEKVMVSVPTMLFAFAMA